MWQRAKSGACDKNPAHPPKIKGKTSPSAPRSGATAARAEEARLGLTYLFAQAPAETGSFKSASNCSSATRSAAISASSSLARQGRIPSQGFNQLEHPRVQLAIQVGA